MKSKLIEHLTGIIFVTAILVSALFVFGLNQSHSQKRELDRLQGLTSLTFVDYNDPFQKALLKDVLNIYKPGQFSNNDSLINAVCLYKQNELTNKMNSSLTEEHLNFSKFIEVIGMFFKFLFVYIIIMVVTYYGVQVMAVWRFVNKKRGSNSQNKLITVLKKTGLVIGSFFLFCPAYVIAYSIRTEINTDTLLFMVLLGSVSNGLLIMYANKFYAFLVTESRKGYVQTAIVKNLDNSYVYNGATGISLKSIFNPVKHFKGHVFDHIFQNAKYQYLSTIKEQASFLISGLIIIEMALNIHGHLCYEMLRQILYKNYDIVILIVLGIFYTVKLTEIATDTLIHVTEKKFGNV